ncbi:MAG: hypothetical protein RMK94_14405 [Armatimonadota bacterium]|nr:hypothetical protein [Armatimonadota bacterium]
MRFNAICFKQGLKSKVVEYCKYVLKHGMPKGGFFYATTNVAFKGLPLDHCLLMLEIRNKYGWYDKKGNPSPEL